MKWLNAILVSALREPLVHFLLLAAAVFAVDAVLGGSGDQRRVITVDQPLVKELKASFESGQGRAPSAKEMNDLVYRWVQNEILYREALSLGLDQGDEMIRERIITKMRQVVINNIVVETPAEDELKRWFEHNKEYYALPARYDFAQFALPGDPQEDAATLAAALGGGEPTGEYADRLKRYDGRTRENIGQMFGARFAAALTAQTPGTWQAVQSDQGWHAARVVNVHAAAPASLAAVGPQAAADWRELRKKQRMADTIAEMRERYDVRLEIGS